LSTAHALSVFSLVFYENSAAFLRQTQKYNVNIEVVNIFDKQKVWRKITNQTYFDTKITANNHR